MQSADFLKLQGQVNDVLSQVSMLLAELVERPESLEDDFLGNDEEDAAHVLLDSRLDYFFKCFKRLSARNADESLSVALVALTKSGEGNDEEQGLIRNEC
jgi:hypothetical protein